MLTAVYFEIETRKCSAPVDNVQPRSKISDAEPSVPASGKSMWLFLLYESFFFVAFFALAFLALAFVNHQKR